MKVDVFFSRPEGFVPVCRETGQSPCRLSTVRSRHGPCIMPLSLRRVSADLKLDRSPAWAATASSNPLPQKAARGSVIRSRHQPGRWPYPEASGERIFLDESRWQGIREYTATVSPMVRDPQPIQQCAHRQYRAMGNLPDARKRVDCYPQRSCTPPFIAQVQNLVPGCSCEVRLQSFSLESGLTKPEVTAALPLRNNTAETLFDKSLDCRLFALGQFPHLIIKTIRYLYGCFHMANHITSYGMMSNTWR